MIRQAIAFVAPVLIAAACASGDATPEANDGVAGIDSLNTRIERAYHDHDARTYATLFTDSAVFEWPATPSVRGRAALQAMAAELWPPLPELGLRLIVSTRRLARDHATEIGAFEESWRDSTGGRTTEFGRYAAVFARQKDGSWLMDRFFGFSDSTRTVPARK
ncbi:MAG TPA: nuclear transport factor 2 family protein [Gemmatimonadaceae bacterium]|nr:nuclear transport factor 2 family protein [Gemmatimonadaceae bacterium]